LTNTGGGALGLTFFVAEKLRNSQFILQSPSIPTRQCDDHSGPSNRIVEQFRSMQGFISMSLVMTIVPFNIFREKADACGCGIASNEQLCSSRETSPHNKKYSWLS
jgi:hypothetical protein